MPRLLAAGSAAATFDFKGRKEKSPRYQIINHNLIKNFSSKFKDLQIHYDNEGIENFTVSNLIFWNAGRETINREDIVAADPIRIHVKNGAAILDEKIVTMNNPSNRFSLEKSNDKSNFKHQF